MDTQRERFGRSEKAPDEQGVKKIKKTRCILFFIPLFRLDSYFCQNVPYQ
jgi:hypothetical protein